MLAGLERLGSGFSARVGEQAQAAGARARAAEAQSAQGGQSADTVGREPAPAYIVDISPEGRALAYGQTGAAGASDAEGGEAATEAAGAGGAEATEAEEECQTCANRQYVDGSDDPSVSFKTPTKMSPGRAAAAVPAHEGEHVANERAEAERTGRTVVSQSVRIFTSVCPECGKVYVSGGETRTVTDGPVDGAASTESGAAATEGAGDQSGSSAVGSRVDLYV